MHCIAEKREGAMTDHVKSLLLEMANLSIVHSIVHNNTIVYPQEQESLTSFIANTTIDNEGLSSSGVGHCRHAFAVHSLERA